MKTSIFLSLLIFTFSIPIYAESARSTFGCRYVEARGRYEVTIRGELLQNGPYYVSNVDCETSLKKRNDHYICGYDHIYDLENRTEIGSPFWSTTECFWALRMARSGLVCTRTGVSYDNPVEIYNRNTRKFVSSTQDYLMESCGSTLKGMAHGLLCSRLTEDYFHTGYPDPKYYMIRANDGTLLGEEWDTATQCEEMIHAVKQKNQTCIRMHNGDYSYRRIDLKSLHFMGWYFNLDDCKKDL